MLLLIPGTAAFAQKKMTPLQYNDKLAAVTDSLYNLGLEWGNQFQQIDAGDKNYGQLDAARKRIAGFTTRKIAEIKREPAVGAGGDKLKAAMLEFLAFEQRMIESAFQPMEKLHSNSSPAETESALKKLTGFAEQEGEALKKVNAAQEAYGKQHGFELEPPEEEDKD